jgi:hypothetical protein
MSTGNKEPLCSSEGQGGSILSHHLRLKICYKKAGEIHFIEEQAAGRI